MLPRRHLGSSKQSESTIKPNPTTPKPGSRKSVLVIPSTVHKSGDVDIEGEETEIAAQITLPQEGGWGWIVVAASFWSICILDGVAYTFGSIFQSITEEFQMKESVIGLVNSIALALYCSCGPFASALINRFGFRAVIMAGAVIASFSLFCTSFVKSYAMLLIFYGVCAGVGYCFVNISAGLVVGFYFERLRSLALGITTTGSSVGITVMFPMNTYLVRLSGWRPVILLHSGFFGIIYFLGMTFRPVVSLTVTNTTTDDPTQTVTYLPRVSTQTVKVTPSRAKVEGLTPTATEKLFSAVSNANFPTAAAVIDEGVLVSPGNNQNQAGVPGTSKSPSPVSRLTLTANAPKGGMSQRHIKQVQSIISRTGVGQGKRNIELSITPEEPKQNVSCWRRICHWEEHIPKSRPMYRDDVFYDGKLETLPAYQKSKIDTPDEHKTGFEYQLAVSRAATTVDLEEKRGLCTTAARRILATMMDPKLLKRSSFLMFGASGFLICFGYLIPYIFLQERSIEVGIHEHHAMWFISVIGFSNAIGRITLGALACKVDGLKLLSTCCLIAGMITAASNLSYNVYFQYSCWVIFGYCIASVVCLRSIVLVHLYGLDKLTNATGMMLLFSGVGCCLSTPVASLVKNTFGFTCAFYLSGLLVFLSGLCLASIVPICKRENQKAQELENRTRQTDPTPLARKRPSAN